MDFKLILKKINNTLSGEERKIFEAWHRESREHRIYFNRVKDNYLKGLDIVDIKMGWEGVSSKINKKEKRKSYFKYAAAAAILVISGSLWLSRSKIIGDQNPELPTVVLDSQIEVGSDKATLTLEDGSKITLEKGESYETNEASSNGERLVYTDKKESPKKAIAQNILTIPRGGQFFVVLVDGTKVWINSETQLKYPVAFAANETREMELMYGEAYFEVSPSSKHKGTHFIVRTEGQQIEVLGTEFNIKAYKGDNTLTTTLVEGKVQVANGVTSKNLTPGHQSILRRNSNKFTVAAVDVYDEVSWKNGFFSFKDRSLEDIMKVLSRWYDVEVVFQNENSKQLTFNGVFRKTQHIDEILNIIKGTNEIDYSVNMKTIIMK